VEVEQEQIPVEKKEQNNVGGGKCCGGEKNDLVCREGECALHPSAPPVEECPICMEDITEGEAVGRCSGDHGQQHLFHATCLSQWIARSANDRRMQIHGARCPVCRGSVEVHEERLRSHLQRAEEKGYEGKAVHPRARDIFQGWLGNPDETTGGGWRKFVTPQNVATAIKVAGVAVTLGHGFRAGWNLDVFRLFTTYEILSAAEGAESALTGRPETMTGTLRVLHLGAGVVGFGARIGSLIIGHRNEQRRRKRDDDDDTPVCGAWQC